MDVIVTYTGRRNTEEKKNKKTKNIGSLDLTDG